MPDNDEKLKRQYFDKIFGKKEISEGKCEKCQREKTLITCPNIHPQSPESLSISWLCYMCVRSLDIAWEYFAETTEKENRNAWNEKIIETYRGMRNAYIDREVILEAKVFPKHCVVCKSKETDKTMASHKDLRLIPFEANQSICQSCWEPIQTDKVKLKELVDRLAKDNNYTKFWFDPIKF